MKILLVEDNFVIAMHLQSILETEGCEVLGPCMSTKDALAIIDEHVVMGALLDFNLVDGESSLAVAQRLHEDECPFVFISGIIGAEAIPDEYRGIPLLRKPIFDDQVRSTVRDFADRAAGRGGASAE